MFANLLKTTIRRTPTTFFSSPWLAPSAARYAVSNGSTSLALSTPQTLTTTTTTTSGWMVQLGVWFIKRTFQPSLLKKKRRHGFLQRKATAGGRKILKRRQLKGRARWCGA